MLLNSNEFLHSVMFEERSGFFRRYEVRLDATELVPGDVLLLGEGDRISADARIVEHSELRVDQSSLTGETTPVRKDATPVASAVANRAETPNLVFAGTSVSSGRGKAVVFRTGMETEFGRIATLTQRLQAAPSPLQTELRSLTKVITVVAVGVGFLVGAVALARLAVTYAPGRIGSTSTPFECGCRSGGCPRRGSDPFSISRFRRPTSS